MKPRPHELTEVRHRWRFDTFPGKSWNVVDMARWAESRAQYHEASELVLNPVGFPLQVDFELNSTCQMRCAFCVHGQTRVEEKVLPFELYEKALREGAEHGLTSIKLNYINEPLLHPGLADHIRFARNMRVLNTYFATNGLRLDRKTGKALIEAGLSRLLVSIDATTPETFKAMRRGSERQFRTVVGNVRDFIRMRNRMGEWLPAVRVNFLKTRTNEHEAGEFLREWNDVADMVGFQTQVAYPDQEDAVLRQENGETFRCSFPFKLLVVACNGDILPCCTFSGRKMVLGNLRTMTLAEAWGCDQMRELRRIHATDGFEGLEICRHCVKGGGA